MRLSLAFIAAAAWLAAGCGGGGSGDQPPAENFGQPGCTAAPDCGACSACMSRCMCDVGDLEACRGFCEGGSGQGGAGATSGAGGAPFGGAGGVAGAGVGGVGGEGGGPPPPPPERQPAGGIRITQVSVNQGVDVTIMENGLELGLFDRNAQLVQSRGGLVRVHYGLDPSWQPRDVVFVLELAVAGVPEAAEIPMFVQAPSDFRFESTINFDVPWDRVTADTAYRVRVLETQPGFTTGGDTSGAEWPPAGGVAPLHAQNIAPMLVTLVPIWQNGILPDTSPGRVNAYRDRLTAMYPVPETVTDPAGQTAPGVQVTVRDPIDPQSVGIPAVTGSGGNWEATLDFLQNVRQGDRPPSPTYYYGLVAPAGSVAQFCGGGCVAGLGSVPPPNSQFGRASMGLGFFPDGSSGDSPDTMAHEVGHSLGRNHSPCSAGGGLMGVDPAYPYPGGSTGVVGFDILARAKKEPGVHTDIMGYCPVQWISDYTYQGILDRLAYVTQFGRVLPPTDPRRTPGRYRVLIVDDDGAVEWGLPRDQFEPPMGEWREIEQLDHAGNVVGTIGGFFERFDHLDGGLLLVPERSVTTAVPEVTLLRPIDVGTSNVVAIP